MGSFLQVMAYSVHFKSTMQYMLKSDICKTYFNFSVPDDQNRGNAFWRSRGRSLRRTPWWHGRITFRGRHGWDVWWGRVWWLQLWSRCQASPMSTMSEDIFVQPSIGPAHVCFIAIDTLIAIILFSKWQTFVNFSDGCTLEKSPTNAHIAIVDSNNCLMCNNTQDFILVSGVTF